MNHRLLQNSAAVIFLLTACAGMEMKNRHNPLLALSGNSEADQVNAKVNVFTEMMVSVHTPKGAFYIDRFEVAELAPGDFFPARNQNPKTQVTLDQARSICESHGKRLCTAFEWKNACLGTHRHRYSYGNAETGGRCNVKSEGIVPSGHRADCASDAGAHDLIGNVMEWVEDDGGATAMGGSFLSGDSADCFTSHFFSRDTASRQIGFRCCVTRVTP